MRLIEPNTGVALREAVSRLMDDNFVRPDRGLPAMPVDVIETPEALVVKAQVPGTGKESLEIHYEKDVLTLKADISAEEKPENGKFLLQERSSGTISRTFRLPYPVDAEQARAEVQNGVLILTLPKLESAKPRQIVIQ